MNILKKKGGVFLILFLLCGFNPSVVFAITATGSVDHIRITVYYTAGDSTAPTVSTLSPTDNATAVATSSNLVITFDEAVDVETGNITIKKTSDDSTIEAIDVTGGLVTGGGTDTITINPTSDLDEETEYYVLIDATAFDDASSNSYAGISSTTAWSFTTIASSSSTGGAAARAVRRRMSDAANNPTFSSTVSPTLSDVGIFVPQNANADEGLQQTNVEDDTDGNEDSFAQKPSASTPESMMPSNKPESDHLLPSNRVTAFQSRVCSRVTKWFSGFAFDRVNARVLRWLGFSCT